jgi:hypothetical protein
LITRAILGEDLVHYNVLLISECDNCNHCSLGNSDETTEEGAWSSVVVKALRYQSDGPGIDPRLCHFGFFPWFLSTKPCALRAAQPLDTRDFSWDKAAGALGEDLPPL